MTPGLGVMNNRERDHTREGDHAREGDAPAESRLDLLRFAAFGSAGASTSRFVRYFMDGKRYELIIRG